MKHTTLVKLLRNTLEKLQCHAVGVLVWHIRPGSVVVTCDHHGAGAHTSLIAQRSSLISHHSSLITHHNISHVSSLISYLSSLITYLTSLISTLITHLSFISLIIKICVIFPSGVLRDVKTIIISF